MAVSPTHSRPGLAMTLEELNQAKVLILDLLGWGLSPENLVEAGISKQCLVPCLRELKLRLPSNIDLSDVVLFDPPQDMNPSPHSPPRPGSPKGDAQQRLPADHSVNEDYEVEDDLASSIQRDKSEASGDQDGSSASDTSLARQAQGPSTMQPFKSSLLDRLVPPVDRGEVANDPAQYADMDEGEPEVHAEASSVDAIEASSLDTPASVPHRGQRKQWKNSQGGKSAPGSKRKAPGHAASEGLD